MAFNVASLSQYIDQSSKDIIMSVVAGANTLVSPFGTILIKEGIKGGSIQQIKIGANTVEFQLGACVSTVSGGTAFSAIDLGTTTYTHYAEFCGQDLSSKFPVLLRAGATSEVDMPKIVMDDYTAKMQNAIGLAAWRAGYLAYSTDLQITGWLTQLINTSLSASTYTVAGVGGSPSVSPFSAANAVATINTLAANRPAALYNLPVEFRMDPAAFEQLKLGYIAANNYFFDPAADPFRMKLNGLVNCYAVADFGLAGAKAIVAVAENGLAFGTDLVSDTDGIATGYDARLNKTWMRMTFSIGAKVVKASEIGVATWA